MGVELHFLCLVLTALSGLDLVSPATQDIPVQIGSPGTAQSVGRVDASQGTGVIRGRVTSAATGQPLRRVRVSAQPQNNEASIIANTNIKGEYVLKGLKPGKYRVTAARLGYLAAEFGQKRIRQPGSEIEIGKAQTVGNIDIALPIGGVMTGRLTDELGEPCDNLAVVALSVRYNRGQRVPFPAGVSTTNDDGEFRISNLEPGEYFLMAKSVETWEAEDGSGKVFGYAPTYFPGTARWNEAGVIGIQIGQRQNSLDFSLVVARAVRVSGVAVSASGDPLAGETVLLREFYRGAGYVSSVETSSVVASRNGTFELRNISPGEYRLGVRNTHGSQGVVETGGASLTVGGEDIDGLVIATKRGSAVSGTVVSEGGVPPQQSVGGLRISLVAIDEDKILPSGILPTDQVVRNDWTFKLTNVAGPYLFRLQGLPDDWTLKAVLLGDRDLTDEGVNIPDGGAEIGPVRIVITQRVTKISGSAVKTDGSPLSDGVVLVFAADEKLWGVGSRFVKLARTDAKGDFFLSGLPPERYCAVLLDYVTSGQWEDHNFLEQIRRDAIAFDLYDGITKQLSLKSGR